MFNKNMFQPQFISGIDWGNPMTANLHLAVLPNVIYSKLGASRVYPFDTATSIKSGVSGRYISINSQSAATGLYAPDCPFSLGFSPGEEGSSAVVVTRGVTGGGSGPCFIGGIDNGFGYSSTGNVRIYASNGIVLGSTTSMLTSKIHTLSYGWKYRTGGADSTPSYVGVDGLFNIVSNNATGGTGAGNNRLYGRGNVSGFTHSAHEVYLILLFKPIIPVAQAIELAKNPWQVFKTLQRPPYFVTMPTSVAVYRPSTDIVVAGWTATPGPGFASQLSETTPNDTNFISSPNASTPDPITMGWSSPIPVGTWDVSIRYKHNGIARPVRLVLLDSINTIIGTSSWIAPASSLITQQVFSVTTTGISTSFRIEVQ